MLLNDGAVKSLNLEQWTAIWDGFENITREAKVLDSVKLARLRMSIPEWNDEELSWIALKKYQQRHW